MNSWQTLFIVEMPESEETSSYDIVAQVGRQYYHHYLLFCLSYREKQGVYHRYISLFT